jgi:uncharacterized protein
MACGFEGFLGLLALGLGKLLSLAPATNLRWNLTEAGLGVAAILPLLALLAVLLRTRWGWMQEIVSFLDQTVRPIFGQWSLVQLALLCLLAGFGEELLFRGVIQPATALLVGPWFAVVGSSVLFGAVHWVTRAYAVLATVIGLYLALLWLYSGNLLVPITTHAGYDFVALVYFLRGPRHSSIPP